MLLSELSTLYLKANSGLSNRIGFFGQFQQMSIGTCQISVGSFNLGDKGDKFGFERFNEKNVS
jgi:hypothetical protein